MDHIRKAFRLLAACLLVLLPLSTTQGSAQGTGTASTAQTSTQQPSPRTLAPTAAACSALASREFRLLAGVPVRVTAATLVAKTSSTPAYCKVEGYVASNARFVLQLPATNWTGQYFESGCGGFCGNLNPSAECVQAFDKGAALGYSDLGTTGNQDLSWTLRQGARLDFAYAANHALAVASKAVITAYYGQRPLHSYFVGCSDGGREALMEAQRFPDDFDGIVAGAPAYLFSYLNSFKHAWQARALLGADGKPLFSAAKATLLHTAVIRACDALDGVTDGQLLDPRECHYDPGALLCPGGTDAATCLTQAQVNGARLAYQAPADAQGVKYYPGAVLPYGSELRWSSVGDESITNDFTQNLSLPLPFQDKRLTVATLQLNPVTFVGLLPMARVYNAMNADLSAFRGRGGKLIMYHGWADDSISPEGTIAYYAALQRHMGGLAATQQFARLFMFPGVYHCSGGYGPSHWDTVSALTAWVEKGVAPAQIIASRYESDSATSGGGFQNPGGATGTPSMPAAIRNAATQNAGAQNAGMQGAMPTGMGPAGMGMMDQTPTGAVVRTLPAFPYPMVPKYKGSGDVNRAENYVPALSPAAGHDDLDWIGKPLLDGNATP